MKWVANAVIALGAILLLLIGMYLAVEDRTGSATIALSFGGASLMAAPCGLVEAFFTRR